MSLEGKVALITGASRGIGRAIAIALGKQNATVIGTATTEDGANKINDVLHQEGIKGHALALNVTDEQSIKNAMEVIQAKFDAPQILVNNAAITRDNLMLRMKDDEWNDVIDTNLNAIYRMSKACLKGMIKARWGRIISIASVVGLAGNPGQANYAAAKAGLIGFSKALALEVASRNVTVNVVAPGLVATDMATQLTEEQMKAFTEHVPMQRMATPEEIAHGVTFLSAPEASYITGETININGGFYMH